MRLDVYLQKHNRLPSREKARMEIRNGNVSVNGETVFKPAFLVREEDMVTVSEAISSYVGWGGEKLAHALESLGIDVTGRTVVDAGASTGGFTQCLLLQGARKVYAVDVGTGQLHESLRTDKRVVVMEKTDLRSLSRETFQESVSLVCLDLSFISLTKVLDTVFDVLDEEGECLALVKPQFEAGRGNVGKNGVVRSKNVHNNVLEGIRGYAGAIGYHLNGACVSPMKEQKGNTEYFFHLAKSSSGKTPDLGTLVESAFSDSR